MAKIEGTLIIDGLIEGKIPALPGAQEKLAAWVNFARAAGMEFDLQVDGGSFSLLADNSPRPVKKFAPNPSEIISAAVGEMIKTIPPAERGKLTSTLRSIEIRAGEEVQTIYAIAPDGTVGLQSRVVEARTHAPPPALTLKERLRMGLFGLVAAVVVIAVSAVFVDYPKLWREIREEVKLPSAEGITVENPVFGEFFAVEKKQMTVDAKTLRLLVRRTDKFPINEKGFAAAGTQPTTQPVLRRLTLDSLARGYVRCECFDGKGELVGFQMVKIGGLKDEEAVEVRVGVAPEAHVTRVVLTN